MMPYQNFYQQPQYAPQQAQGQIQPQTQSGGFIIVRSENEARNYPVAPGNSITFFNESQPYCYKKTMSFSPLDHPTFERYRIVKEEAPVEPIQPLTSDSPMENIDKELKAEIEALRGDVDDLKAKIKGLTTKPARGGKKDDESE